MADVHDIPLNDLVSRAVLNAVNREKSPRPAWSIVSDAFGLGSGYAAQLCIAHGIDPEKMIKRRARVGT